MTDGEAVTFDESAAKTIAETFGWTLTDRGYLCRICENGMPEMILSVQGETVHISELAGVVRYRGETIPLRDDFTEVAEYVATKQQSGDSE
jgi:hypothetical protein